MRARYLAAAALALLPTVASASETVKYTYDAKGRLTQVQHVGGRNDGTNTTYSFDAADNRTSVTTTGAWFDSGGVPTVVVPLGRGLKVIPLPAS